MIKRKLLVVLTAFLFLCVQQTIKAQPLYPILLNEYSASNIGTPVDNYGEQSDWVELRNAHTAQVNLAGYYLSNDKNNLRKWKFPAGFLMGVETYSVVWLSGRNTVANGNYHANFTLEQCKNQWLILSSPDGVVRDCVFVQKTKAGHAWGRTDITNRGIGAWRLFTANSFLYPNPTMNYYKGYVPKPTIVAYPNASNAPASSATNAGGFVDPVAGAPLIYFKLESPVLRYDTAFHSCYKVYFTTDGSYPVVGAPNTQQAFDSTNPVITVTRAALVRAIAVTDATNPNCSQDYLPSFCETNTYFNDADYQNFNGNFGVVSIAIDPADTLWFYNNGNPPATPIHVEYYDGQRQVSEGYGQITRPPNEAWKTAQRGFNITIDDKQGFGCGFEGNIFNVEGLGTSTRTEFPTLQLYGGDIEAHSPVGLGLGTGTISYGTGLRDVFMESLSTKYNINVNPLHVKPVIAFKNGKYWGVFTLKEVYDKYYEEYYHKQSKDQLDLSFYHTTDGYIAYDDGSVSRYSPVTSFKTGVYNVVTTRPMSSVPFYNSVTSQLDISSFQDWMILQSYALNSDMWKYNIAYAKGAATSAAGNTKWHYYLWNMPAIFSFTAVPNSAISFSNSYYSACDIYKNDYVVSQFQAGNGHGAMMRAFMNPNTGSGTFQTQYKARYQDLLNTALKCDNILKHFDYIYELYGKEMRYHELPENGSPFASQQFMWDTNMVNLRLRITDRCGYMTSGLTTNGCYGMTGPYNISVNVEPAGSGSVKLNTILLDSYPWYGSYYGENMAFQAIPTNTTYIFSHWEFKTSHPLNQRPLSYDSLSVSFDMPDDVVAVFTDKSADIQSGINVPTGFTPNNDGRNDDFKPLGSAPFTSNYEMTVWNRWGEEVFRTLDPSQGWDGKYHGQDSQTGVYAYIIKYKNIYGEDKLLKGNVTLTR